MEEQKQTCAVQPKEDMASRLAKVGFKAAASKLPVALRTGRKMMMAYEHYRAISPEKIDAFNKELKAKTLKKVNAYESNYNQLKFVSIADYTEVPPASVLDSLEKAQSLTVNVNGEKVPVFDKFEVAYIANVKEVRTPDPLLLGRVENCPDAFFIDQWDDDVKIQDLLKEHEG